MKNRLVTKLVTLAVTASVCVPYPQMAVMAAENDAVIEKTVTTEDVEDVEEEDTAEETEVQSDEALQDNEADEESDDTSEDYTADANDSAEAAAEDDATTSDADSDADIEIEAISEDEAETYAAEVTDTVSTYGAGYTGWKHVNGKDYWYEDGVKQGTTGRGKEIYDPSSDAWYWLDSVQDGAKAVSKDVYMPYTVNGKDSNGKWVRYDANGHMVKGWQTTDAGTYYFDPTTGAMAKGITKIDGKTYYFNLNTGTMEKGHFAVNNDTGEIVYGYEKPISVGLVLNWYGMGNPPANSTIYWFDEDTGVAKDCVWLSYENEANKGNSSLDNQYWYEDGVRQGYNGNRTDSSYRGKEIYDPASDAWYWLDNNAYGKAAKNKDVYQPYTIQGEDNIGKWVRYDKYGHMIKGWQTTTAGTYYFDLKTGAMAKGSKTIDGKSYYFDESTGTLDGSDYTQREDYAERLERANEVAELLLYMWPSDLKGVEIDSNLTKAAMIRAEYTPDHNSLSAVPIGYDKELLSNCSVSYEDYIRANHSGSPDETTRDVAYDIGRYIAFSREYGHTFDHIGVGCYEKDGTIYWECYVIKKSVTHD